MAAQNKRAAAVVNRCSKRPLPGQPFANVENKRCRPYPFAAYKYSQEHTVVSIESEARKVETGYPTFRGCRGR
jgi:hypothetical protein